jgi:hypothetical protein
LSKHSFARTFASVAVLGIAGLPLASWTAYSMKSSSTISNWSLPRAEAATFAEPQTVNRGAKGDKLARPAAAAVSESSNTYALAAVEPSSKAEPDASDRREPTALAVAPIPTPPLPWHKPKRPPEQPNGLLDDAQIASLKGRLRLTSAQAEYWPAVEEALRDFSRQQMREARRTRSRDGSSQIDVNRPEVQRLIWAAMPLLRQLREDQKREVRMLVRVMGLGSVASHI